MAKRLECNLMQTIHGLSVESGSEAPHRLATKRRFLGSLRYASQLHGGNIEHWYRFLRRLRAITDKEKLKKVVVTVPKALHSPRLSDL